MPGQSQRILLLLLLIPCWIIAWQYDIDLVNLHVAGKFSLTDPSRVYAYNENYGRFFYGPITLALFYPLSYLSYTAVKVIWILLQTLAFIVFWKGFSTLYPETKNRNSWIWIGIFIASINPIHNNFQSNNIQLMIAAALLLSEVLSSSQKSRLRQLAGALCAVTAMIKVFPGFMAVYYFIAKDKEVRKGLIWGVLFSLFLPLVFFGWSNGILLFTDFLTNLTTYSAENSLVKVPDILCLPSLIARYFGSEAAAGPYLKTAMFGIPSVFFLWVFYLKIKGRLDGKDRELWAMALALMTLLNPSTRPHYYIFFVPAFASVFLKKTRTMALSALVALALIAFTQDAIVGKIWNDRLEAWSIPTYGMLILSLALLFSLPYLRLFPRRR